MCQPRISKTNGAQGVEGMKEEQCSVKILSRLFKQHKDEGTE